MFDTDERVAMTSTHAPPRIGLLEVRTADHGTLTVTAERTESEHLRIVPYFGPFGLDGDWCLAHAPTGRLVSGTVGLTPPELRDMARLLADLDVWASDDPRVFAREYVALGEAVAAARKRVER